MASLASRSLWEANGSGSAGRLALPGSLRDVLAKIILCHRSIARERVRLGRDASPYRGRPKNNDSFQFCPGLPFGSISHRKCPKTIRPGALVLLGNASASAITASMQTPRPTSPEFTRRHFIQTLAGVTAAAMSPLARAQAAGGPRLLLGYDTYSIRNLRWKAAQVLEHAAALKLDVVMMAPPCFDNLEDASLLKVKEQAERLGVKVSPSLGCICPHSKAWRPKQGDAVTYLRDCIRVAKTLGSPFFRVLMGVMDDRKGAVPIPQMMEETIKALRAVRQPALDAGVKISLENHQDMQAWQM